MPPLSKPNPREPDDLLTVEEVMERYRLSTRRAALKRMHEAGGFRPAGGRAVLLVRWSNLIAWERAREATSGRSTTAPSAVPSRGRRGRHGAAEVRRLPPGALHPDFWKQP